MKYPDTLLNLLSLDKVSSVRVKGFRDNSVLDKWYEISILHKGQFYSFNGSNLADVCDTAWRFMNGS